MIKLLNVESLNFSFKQIFILVYLRYDYYNYFFFQVVAVAGFTQVEEVEGILVVPRDGAEKVVREFFREGWVEDPTGTVSWVDLEEVVELLEMEEEEEAEGILAEAVELMNMIPVGVEVDPLMLETIRPMTVVTTQLAMVKSPLL